MEKEKFPVCICLQGHTTGFHISIDEKKYDGDEEFLETSTFAIDAVKNGYAALAIEQRGMGERTTLQDRRGRAPTYGCMYTAMTALMLGRTLIAPRKLIVSVGGIDPIFPLSGTKEVYSVIEKIYQKEGAAENCRLIVFPDKPHYFDKERVFPAINKFRGEQA